MESEKNLKDFRTVQFHFSIELSIKTFISLNSQSSQEFQNSLFKSRMEPTLYLLLIFFQVWEKLLVHPNWMRHNTLKLRTAEA